MTKTDSVPTVRPIILYLLIVFLGAALISPWLYWSVQAFAPESHLAQNPFHRYVDRVLLILALGGIWPILSRFELNSWKDVGVVSPRLNLKRLLVGFLIGFASLASTAAIVLASHVRMIQTDRSINQILLKVFSSMATALGVAILEELFFRGAIMGVFRKIWNWRTALVVSSIIYALVHFLGRAEINGRVTWHSGLEILPLMLRGFVDVNMLIPAFINLILAGLILGWVYKKTGNLYLPIGLHSGWIFWLKFYGYLTAASDVVNGKFWGSERLIDGWLSFFVLSITFLLVLIFLSDKPQLKEK